jgi:hypothetical protein
VDARAPRQLAQAAKIGTVTGGGVDQDLLGAVEQAAVGDRRIGLGKPKDRGQIAEQQGSQQRGGMLQAGVVGRQRHPVVADAHPAGHLGHLALDHQLRVKAVGPVAAQDERSRGTVRPQPGEGVLRRARGHRGGGCDDQVQRPGQGVPVPVVLVDAVKPSELVNQLVDANVLAPPPAALRHRSHSCLQLRPRIASSSSASGGP